MSSLSLTILTPKGIVYDGDILSAYFPTTKGPLGVLPGHTPYLASLNDKGVIEVLTNEKQKYFFPVFYGAVEVKGERIFVLSEDCVMSSSLDQAKEYLEKKAPLLQKGDSLKKAQASLRSGLNK